MSFLRVTVDQSFAAFTLAVDFEAPMPGVVGLFGPSGSGKSSLLSAIAGVSAGRGPTRATVELGGAALHKLPAERRRIGMVFQDGKLFPHLRVRDNLRFGMRRAPRGPIGFDDVVDLLGLREFLKRWPRTLSGGERQRVAIGRALLSQPRLLLMDEPLAGLDAARRDEILPYLSQLRMTLRMPIIYASHAPFEIARLADTVVLLEAGRVQAFGPVGEVFSRTDLPLAAREDAAGVLLGYVSGHDPARGLSAISCGGVLLQVPLVEFPRGADVRVRVPAREIILALEMPRMISVNNIFPATVLALGQDVAGHAALVELDLGGGTLLARVTQDAATRLGLKRGAGVLALMKSVSVELLPG